MPATSSKKRKHGKKLESPVAAASALKPVRRVVIDFPLPLYDATENAATELATNRSNIIRNAVKLFIEEMHRQKLEEALMEGYTANAASALSIVNDMMGAEADFV